jgi:hypothetical protein
MPGAVAAVRRHRQLARRWVLGGGGRVEQQQHLSLGAEEHMPPFGLGEALQPRGLKL